MNRKTKKIISLVILLVGIILLIVSSTISLNDNDKANNNNINENNNNTCNDSTCNNENNNTEEETYKYLEIENLCVVKQEDDVIKVNFDLVNNNEEKIINKKIMINFYNDNELLYEYGYDIVNIDIYETNTIDVMLDVEYNKITKYEFVFESIKKEITLNCN